uniref:BTB domain-containing protein n=1 Tax=Ditylenchus dipsaci TaxID=166011 RepID=A0A915EU68_9BILA
MEVSALEINESTLKNEVSKLKMEVSALEINKSVMQERVSELDQTDEDFANYFDSPSTLSYDADCILQLDGKPVGVNKAYLSTHSVVFKNMFKDDVDKKEYDIKDVTCEEFTELLKVIYPVRKPITDRNVESLLKLGHRFGMADMLIVCQNFLLRNPNLVSLARRTWMAQEYGLERLLTSSAKAPDL